MQHVSQFLLSTNKGLVHFCPACREMHLLNMDVPTAKGSRWDWNGDIMQPTFSPGARFKAYNGRRLVQRCHYQLINGTIIFQKDCMHEFRGLIIDLPPIPESFWARSVVRNN